MVNGAYEGNAMFDAAVSREVAQLRDLVLRGVVSAYDENSALDVALHQGCGIDQDVDPLEWLDAADEEDDALVLEAECAAGVLLG